MSKQGPAAGPELASLERLNAASLTFALSRRMARIACPLARYSCELSSSSSAYAGGGTAPDRRQPAAASTSVWPIPLAAGGATYEGEPGRSDARQDSAATQTATRLVVAALNWLALGRPRGLPPAGAAQRWRTPAQQAVWDRLSERTALWTRTAGPGASLKRHFGKYSALHDTIFELSNIADSIERDLLPYGRPRQTDSAPAVAAPAASLRVPTVSAIPLDPSRISHKLRPTFPAARFITDPLLKAGFLEPGLLVIPGAPPPTRRAAVMCGRSALAQLMKNWDQVGRPPRPRFRGAGASSGRPVRGR